MALPFTNLLLESLPAADQAALHEHLEPVPLPINSVIFEAEQVPQFIYLMTSGMASLVTPMIGGEALEVGLVGREGFAGGVHLLGPELGSSRCFMQIAGTALRMDFRRFGCAFQHQPGLRHRVLQYVQYETYILNQLSACNRVHELEERLARWLLMVADRLGSSDIPLTQEFLGQMLGTRRSTVTVAAGILQRSGLIEYRRGHVKILDRQALEGAACECYAITRRLFHNLFRNPA